MAAIARVLVVGLLACILIQDLPARAQEAGAVELHLVRQPVWHEPGDPLAISIRVSNRADEPLDGFIVTVAAHSRVLSRSELHASFDAPPTFEASRITAREAPELSIPSGGSEVITLDQSVAELQSLAAATENGVYPLTISLFDSAGSRLLDSLTTPLIYFQPGPEQRPLHAAVVVPLNEIPRRSPDGTFEADAEGRWPLEDAMAEGGWLDGLIGAIDSATGPQPAPPPPPRSGRRRGRPRRPPPPGPRPAHIGLAPMPRLIEELQDMANGYDRSGDDDVETVRAGASASGDARDLLARIDGLMGTKGIQPMLAPYSFPDLSSVEANLIEDHIAPQISEAETVLNDAMATVPGREWTLAPGGRVDSATLERLQLAKAGQSLLLAEDSLEPITDPEGSGCPDPPLSFTCTIRVETGVGESSGYALDPNVQLRLFDVASGVDRRLMLQRFFAETSAIREEAPGREGRVVAIMMPALWYPTPAISRLLFSGLRDAPWLETVTPSEGLQYAASHVDPVDRRVRSEIPQLDGEPDPTYFDTVEDAEELVDMFKGVQPPPELLQRLSRNTLTSQSRLWWEPTLIEQGEGYAEEAAAEAESELSRISIGDSDEISLTSREAPVQLVVINDAAYPVRVDVKISSPDLGIDQTFEETIQARSIKQVKFDVVAESSGISSLLVSVETPSGDEITTKTIQIRSTEFNEIALGLTFGALAFLVLFYITRGARRRRSGYGDEVAA